MKMILKSALALAAIAGAAAMVTVQADAGVGVSIGIGVPAPVYVSPYGADYSPYDGDYYYDPIYFGGAWYHGPYRWRMQGGERVFFMNGGWHRNEWRGGPVPTTMAFRNGGSFRDGHNIGFGDADRINARFHPANAGMRQDRRDMKSDRQDTRQDRRDIHDDRHDDNHGDAPRN